MDEDSRRHRIESTVRAMVQPLVADGGRFTVEPCDNQTHTVVVHAAMSNCGACAMSEDSLALLLEEALQRVDAELKVTVVSE